MGKAVKKLAKFLNFSNKKKSAPAPKAAAKADPKKKKPEPAPKAAKVAPKPAPVAPAKPVPVAAPVKPLVSKPTSQQKILTAEGWKRLMIKKVGKPSSK